MTAPAPDAARRLAHRVSVALLATVLCTTSCATTLSSGQAMSTTTLATASSSAAASSGPGVQPSFETGVPDAVVSFTGGLPAGVEPVGIASGSAAAPADEVRRSGDGDLLIVTWGSTTCPRMPVNVTAVDLITIDIVTGTVRVDPGSNADTVPETSLCTNDLGPTTSTVRLPDGAAGSGPLTVVVDGTAHTLA